MSSEYTTPPPVCVCLSVCLAACHQLYSYLISAALSFRSLRKRWVEADSLAMQLIHLLCDGDVRQWELSLFHTVSAWPLLHRFWIQSPRDWGKWRCGDCHQWTTGGNHTRRKNWAGFQIQVYTQAYTPRKVSNISQIGVKLLEVSS